MIITGSNVNTLKPKYDNLNINAAWIDFSNKLLAVLNEAIS